MAENSIWWTTNGTGDGASSGYTQARMVEFFRMVAVGHNATNLGGVAPDYLNKLAVSGSVSPVAVATGGAFVYGFGYINDASVNVTVPTPSTSTRIDRIVLRADWTAQTVRITRIAGTEGGGAPALVQTAGTTWDIPLAQASITTSGTITLTDQREWLSLVGDGAVTAAKLASDAVTTAKILADNVTFAKMQNIATDSLIGRDTASTGDPESITLNATLSMTGAGTLQRAALTGDVTAPVGSNAMTIATGVVSRTHAKTDGAFLPHGYFVTNTNTTFTTTAVTLPLATAVSFPAVSVYSSDGTEITITEAGTYMFTYTFTIGHNTGSAVAVALCWLEKNGAEMTGSRVYIHVPTAEAASASKTLFNIVSTTTDTFRLRVQRVLGSDTLQSLNSYTSFGFFQLHK